MILEERKKIIYEKVINKNLNFTEEEYFILTTDNDLLDKVLKYIFTNEDLKNRKDIYSIIKPCLFLENPIYIDSKNYYNLIINSFYNNLPNLEEIENLSQFLSDKDKEKILYKYFLFLYDKKIPIKVIEADQEMLNILLDNERYDVIEKIIRSSMLDNDIIKRFKQEYPFDKYKIPLFLKGYEISFFDYLNKFNLEQLIVLYDDIVIFNRSKDKKELVELELNKRIINNEKIENYSYLISNYFIKYLYFSNLDESIINKFIDNNIELAFYLRNEDNNMINYFDKPIIIDKIIKLIKDKKVPDNPIILNNFINTKEEIVKELINNNYLDIAIKSDYFLKYLDLAIPYLKNYNNLELHSFVIKRDFTLQDNSKYIDKVINNKDLKESLFNSIKNKNIIIYGYTNPEYINFCIENNMIREFDRNIIEKIITNNPDKFKSILENDLKESAFIFKYYADLFFKYPKSLEYYSNLGEYFKENIFNYIKEESDIDITEELFISLSNILKNEVNLKHLYSLKDLFGLDIVKYLKNECILNIINLSDNEFNKFISLFPNIDYNLKDLEKSYLSMKQYEFSKIFPNINIFINIINYINNGNLEYETLLFDLESVMDNQFKLFINKKYPELEYLSKRNLLEKIILNLKNNNNSLYYKDILHTICNYYLDRKRGEYKNNLNLYNELNINYKFDEHNKLNSIIKYCLDKNPLVYYKDKKISFLDLLISKLNKNGIDNNLSKDLVLYYLNNKSNLNSNLDDIKNNISLMIKTCKNIINEIDEDTLIDIEILLDENNLIKRIYYLDNEKIDIYKIFSLIDIDIFKKSVLEDKKVYNSLKNVIERNKLHILPIQLCKYIKENEYFKADYCDLSAFLTYYNVIVKTICSQRNIDIDKIDINLVDIILNGLTYSNTSYVYSMILGRDDANLIKSNPKPNAATTKVLKNKRLEESIDYTIKAFKRKYMAIPEINETIDLNNRKLQIIAGNFLSPSNLTHGERTGSCMRIGGVGESLFKFCLLDKNGFHVEFRDLETNEYISRVSGFRNGNTIFLNQLRHSLNKSLYSDFDLENACKFLANELIEKTKNSSFPIDNVFISPTYVFEGECNNLVDFDIKSVQKGLPSFYCDILDEGILLASSDENNNLVELNLSNELIPDYLTTRESVKETNNYQIFFQNAIRVHAIKEILKTKNYKYIESLEIESFIYGIFNYDFYIYIDEKYNIHEEIINLDKRALEELELARIKINEFKIKGDNNGYRNR